MTVRTRWTRQSLVAALIDKRQRRRRDCVRRGAAITGTRSTPTAQTCILAGTDILARSVPVALRAVAAPAAIASVIHNPSLRALPMATFRKPSSSSILAVPNRCFRAQAATDRSQVGAVALPRIASA